MHHLLEEEASTAAYTGPRGPSTALLLSLVLPGMGQIYNGQLVRGLLFAGMRFCYPPLFAWARTATWFYGLILLLATEMAIRLYAGYDAVKFTGKPSPYLLKPYNRWYYHLLIAALMIAAGWYYNPGSILGVDSFFIPTTSGEPTLQRGDKLIADLEAYKHALPVPGDIVVYIKEGQSQVLRVAGKPGDTVVVSSGILSINGHTAATIFTKEQVINNIVYNEYDETFSNGQQHKILTLKRAATHSNNNRNSVIVPAGCYYLLGDNRDNAADSRHFGLITKQQIIGRVVYSYWGSSQKRIDQDFRKQ